MIRYNKKYQDLADKFAIDHGNGEWIGADYLGLYHEACGNALGPGWLAFGPIWRKPVKVGVFHYIFINEDSIVLYCDIYTIPHKTIFWRKGTIVHQKKIKPIKPKPKSPIV